MVRTHLAAQFPPRRTSGAAALSEAARYCRVRSNVFRRGDPLSPLTDFAAVAVNERTEARRSQGTEGGQRWRRQSSQVSKPTGGASIGSVPWSSPGEGISIVGAHVARSFSDIGQLAWGASAWR